MLFAMAQIAVDTGISFTCESQEECKRKCEELGGRWKRDETGTTQGTCTLTSIGAHGGLGDFLAPANLLAVLVVAGASFFLGRLVRRASGSARRAAAA
jgi:hypothetical protein